MSKLSLEALSQRADAVATEELLNSINGGTENCCHPPDCYTGPSEEERATVKDNTAVGNNNRKVETLK